MTNRLDRRIRRTRKSLQDALIALILEKGYEAVTVQDVIDRANVGRATFYAHFQDKEALLLSEFEQLTAHFDQHLSEEENPDLWCLSLLMFQHAQHYHRIYKAIVGKQSGQIMQSYLRKYLAGLMQEYLQSRWSSQMNKHMPLEVLLHHLVTSLLSLLMWWLDNNLPYPAERMAQMYQQLTQPGVDSILQEK